MVCVVVSACKVASYPEGGGHFWVYMQYVQGLRKLGADVFWLERFHQSDDNHRDQRALKRFFERMDRYGLGGKTILYVCRGTSDRGGYDFINVPRAKAEKIFREADLLLNFEYEINPIILEQFSRTALVDIDPGLFQYWVSTDQLNLTPHDIYFTTGETVGTPAAKFPDCDLSWAHIRPLVCLDLWPYEFNSDCGVFTSITHWHTDDWIKDAEMGLWENTKRVSFLKFLRLPQMTSQKLELALNLELASEDRRTLELHGWQIRDAAAVAGGPETYRSYIAGSRGEFSCAKPSCMHFENAWVSDRSICYLSSGKPVIVQYTGKSSYLPNGEGMFRFSTAEEAVEAFETVNSDYERHCRKAREIAESLFDSRQILESVLNVALN